MRHLVQLVKIYIFAASEDPLSVADSKRGSLAALAENGETGYEVADRDVGFGSNTSKLVVPGSPPHITPDDEYDGRSLDVDKSGAAHLWSLKELLINQKELASVLCELLKKLDIPRIKKDTEMMLATDEKTKKKMIKQYNSLKQARVRSASKASKGSTMSSEEQPWGRPRSRAISSLPASIDPSKSPSGSFAPGEDENTTQTQATSGIFDKLFGGDKFGDPQTREILNILDELEGLEEDMKFMEESRSFLAIASGAVSDLGAAKLKQMKIHFVSAPPEQRTAIFHEFSATQAAQSEEKETDKYVLDASDTEPAPKRRWNMISLATKKRENSKSPKSGSKSPMSGSKSHKEERGRYFSEFSGKSNKTSNISNGNSNSNSSKGSPSPSPKDSKKKDDNEEEHQFDRGDYVVPAKYGWSKSPSVRRLGSAPF